MKSFLHGKKNLNLPALPPVASATSFRPVGEAARGPHEPNGDAPAASVEVVKEGEKVVRLIVTCSCGERVEVDCLYPAGS